MAPKLKVLFGTVSAAEWSDEVRDEFFSLMEAHNVKAIDTAFQYSGSEKALGDCGAPKRFTVDTKAPGFTPGVLKKDNVLKGCKQSLEDLKVDSVDTYFLHAPDSATPFEETYEAIQELYTAGKFKHFGLSNFQPEEVKAYYEYATSKGFVLPTVYQGNYNPVARRFEADLFPLLRKYKMSFNAYSPLAGGYFVQKPETFSQENIEGRFDRNTFHGQMYHKMYNRPALVAALPEWEAISKQSGVSKAALAYRWVMYHSALKPELGDGIIVGASRPSQLKETLEALDAGPLDPAVVDRIQKVWEAVKHEAPLDNGHMDD